MRRMPHLPPPPRGLPPLPLISWAPFFRNTSPLLPHGRQLSSPQSPLRLPSNSHFCNSSRHRRRSSQRMTPSSPSKTTPPPRTTSPSPSLISSPSPPHPSRRGPPSKPPFLRPPFGPSQPRLRSTTWTCSCQMTTCSLDPAPPAPPLSTRLPRPQRARTRSQPLCLTPSRRAKWT